MEKEFNLYFASPFGFSEAGRLFMYEKIMPILEIELGYTVLDPWQLTPDHWIEAIDKLPYGEEKKKKWASMNMLIGENNQEAIKQSNGILAILDGVDVDSGTASEIGYGFGLGKKIVGYRNDFRLAGDNEGSLVNLQVEYFIKASNGTIVSGTDELAEKLESVFGSLKKGFKF